MHFATLAISALAVLLPALAQFVEPPKDLKSAKGYANVTVRYKQVPVGVCELDPKVKSFSGYADVAEDQHIFWWFFEARAVDPKTAPLTVWINGGPGSSSMIGLFQENGPCFINSNGKPYNNTHSWSQVSNMIYIDQPTQVGLSYSIPIPGYIDPISGYIVELPSNKCPEYAADWDCATYSYPNETLTASTTPGGAPNFWKTLQGFMGAFPQYSRHGFYFATESYGGHYGPIYNEYLETQNAANIPGAHNISLEGVLIGNDPLIQYQAYYNFSVGPGISMACF
jgi:carboxypeptidase C (cathepsin A)